VEWLKVQALNSNPSTVKKTKQNKKKKHAIKMALSFSRVSFA
jgi:hypothetical protein